LIPDDLQAEILPPFIVPDVLKVSEKIGEICGRFK
jgi:hypothetical protein